MGILHMLMESMMTMTMMMMTMRMDCMMEHGFQKEMLLAVSVHRHDFTMALTSQALFGVSAAALTVIQRVEMLGLRRTRVRVLLRCEAMRCDVMRCAVQLTVHCACDDDEHDDDGYNHDHGDDDNYDDVVF